MKKLVAPLASISLVIGAVGGALIQTSEGKFNDAYPDPVGIWTICFGHTGPEVRKGLHYTDQQCEDIFLNDVAKHSVVLSGPKSCIGDALKPGTNRYDAVLSFVFNVGNAKFCASTMAKQLKAKDYVGASAEFPKWVYAKGKVFNGLITRRDKERKLFNSTAPWLPYQYKHTILKREVLFL